MPFELPLRCQCGHLRGVMSEVTPSSGFRNAPRLLTPDERAALGMALPAFEDMAVSR
jgi:hypothetical protein